MAHVLSCFGLWRPRRFLLLLGVPCDRAQRARKQKLQRLFKQGVSRVVRERAEEMDRMAKKGSLYVLDAFAGR